MFVEIVNLFQHSDTFPLRKRKHVTFFSQQFHLEAAYHQSITIVTQQMCDVMLRFPSLLTFSQD